MSKKQFFEDLVGMANWKSALGLHSNEAINPIENGVPMRASGMFGSIPASYHNIKNAKMGWKEGIQAAHQNAEGSYAPAAIAGSFIAAGAAYRVASGGGVYKDQNGNTNLVGIPFI